jgi:hypothetical protein
VPARVCGGRDGATTGDIGRPQSAVGKIPEVDKMTVIAILVLVGVALYAGKRWSDSMAENAQLKAQVRFLKRRLTITDL